MGLNVLAVSYRDGDLLSAQVVFAEDRRVRALGCAHTFADAARFLSEHPGAVVFYDESAPKGTEVNLISRLVSEANPSALITFERGDLTSACVNVQIFKEHEALRGLFLDGNMLGTIQAVWRYCKEIAEMPRSSYRLLVM